MRGVLDASVLAPGLVSSQGAGSFLIKAARVARFDLIVSQYLLDEVRECLTKDFGRTVEEAADLLELVDRISVRVEPTDIPALCRDPDDDPILALAADSGAFFLATYDHDLMAVGAVGACGIVAPQTAIQLVTADASAVSDETVPGVSDEDRSRWRYEDRGAPLFMAVLFLEWARNVPGISKPEAYSRLRRAGRRRGKPPKMDD